MSPSIKDAITTHTPSPRWSSPLLATDGATDCTTSSPTAADTITDLGATTKFKVALSPPLRGSTAAPLLYSLGHGSTATPELQYAALSQTSRPVDAWLLQMRLAFLLSEQQEQLQKGEKAAWPRYENDLYDDGSPPPEFWYTDSSAASPSAHRDQTETETHSSPDPLTPPPIQPTPTTRRKRTHDRLTVDDEGDCRGIASECGPGKAEPRGVKKRRMNESGGGAC